MIYKVSELQKENLIYYNSLIQDINQQGVLQHLLSDQAQLLFICVLFAEVNIFSFSFKNE